MQNEEFDFENELDPVEAVKLQELYDAEIENAMRSAFEFIQEMGETQWLTSREIPVNHSRKAVILENMMNWFADPRREEYETAAKLKRMLETLKP